MSRLEDFYCFIAVLDSYSRVILVWELYEKVEERDAELDYQMVMQIYPDAGPRIIYGSQFRRNDFKRSVNKMQATHVMSSPS